MSQHTQVGHGEEAELTQPRADERLPLERLIPYLRLHLDKASGEPSLAQFPGGRANLTYLIKFDEQEYVLRRPPLGPVAPSAHDMKREYRVLSKLCDQFRLAPRSFLYCDDDSIIGAPFQIMERRHGLVIRDQVPAPFDDNPTMNRRIGDMLVDALADLHLVDREQAGLAELGRPEGFVKRQLDGWSTRWQAASHEHNPQMTNLIDWLTNHRVESKYESLIHNDYKLDNVLVATNDPGQAVAILDWDMCTGGDPLSDLGYLLNQWCQADDDPGWIEMAAMPTQASGFATRREAVERYANRTGFDVSNINWYYAFACMKFAVIIQQIFIRYHRGQTRDERFEKFDDRARQAVAKGLSIVANDH